MKKVLSQKFGEKKTIEGKEFFLFPKPEKLANASIASIGKCGLGYRTKYVKKAAVAVNETAAHDASDCHGSVADPTCRATADSAAALLGPGRACRA